MRRLLLDVGAEPLPFGGGGAPQVLRDIGRVILALFTRRSGVVVGHFPTYTAAGRAVLRTLALRHRVVLVLHDLDQERGVAPTPPMSTLAVASAVLVTGLLDTKVPSAQLPALVTRIRCWDYLTEVAPVAAPTPDGILFAGSLGPDKAAWLYDRRRRGPLTLAGVGFDSAHALESDHYVGPFDPDRPDFGATVGWGLVWDGDSAEALSGPTGVYQRINQPHKFSLYLAAGLPVICHRDAAVASLVHSWGVGLTVERVDHAGPAVAALTPADRLAMVERVREERRSIVTGRHFTTAWTTAQSALLGRRLPDDSPGRRR